VPVFALGPGKVFLCKWTYRDGDSSDKRIIIASTIVDNHFACLMPTSNPEHFGSPIDKCNYLASNSFFQISPTNSDGIYEMPTFIRLSEAYFTEESVIQGRIIRELGQLGQCWAEIKNCIKRTMRDDFSGKMYKAICI
jgi:hypothetical protein